ncbi:hypothetical protein [Saccharopolyspora pogona]|uniref:hypothetical protein n=1 Tax=Saccharopolyspora pogona TaxID=333966 RepID=UPI001CC23C9E|nr:hypothetical protein [Saccharopolyspora pogona]
MLHSLLPQLPRPLLARRTWLRGTWLTALRQARGYARMARRRSGLTTRRPRRGSRPAA